MSMWYPSGQRTAIPGVHRVFSRGIDIVNVNAVLLKRTIISTTHIFYHVLLNCYGRLMVVL